MKPAEEWAKEYNKLYTELEKEADEKVGDGVVQSEDIHETIIKQIQLDAMKEGMRRAAKQMQRVASDSEKRGWTEKADCYAYAQYTLLAAAEQLTEKDLST